MDLGPDNDITAAVLQLIKVAVGLGVYDISLLLMCHACILIYIHESQKGQCCHMMGYTTQVAETSSVGDI